MNKKYHFLDNKSWLFEELCKRPMHILAEDLAKISGVQAKVLAGCIRFRVNRYFSKEQIKLIKKCRIFHKKQKSI